MDRPEWNEAHEVWRNPCIIGVCLGGRRQILKNGGILENKKMDSWEKRLNECRSQAEKGRDFWLSLVKEYQIATREYVLLLPLDTPEYHEPALKHLEEFLVKKGASRAIVLYAGEMPDAAEYEKKISEYSSYIIDVKKIRREDYENLVRFYCLYEFTDRLIIASLEEPDGRLGKNMVGKKGLTLEDVVKVTLYD